MLTNPVDKTLTQHAQAVDSFTALAHADRLIFSADRSVLLGAEYQPDSTDNDIIEGRLCFSGGEWEMILELSTDPDSQSCWDEGIIASSKHSIRLPARCWSPELIAESISRWLVMAFPEQHLPEITVELEWSASAESHQNFIANKRADSENRRLLG
jgi:hypothetical protein